MLINIIDHHAEQNLLTLLESLHKKNGNMGGLYFARSKLTLKPSENQMIRTLRPILEEKNSTVYFFSDGDLVMTWSGGQKAMLNNLRLRLQESYPYPEGETLDRYYDLQAHGEELRELLRERIERNYKAEDIAPTENWKPGFSPHQLRLLAAAVNERKIRDVPSILIVEDQKFSRELLAAMLRLRYNCYLAANAEEALLLYAEHAPSISFLDVELPDMNGHDLAAFLRKYDPDAFIAMVTANNFEKDVMKARKNKTQGFIAKPYGPQKIMEIVDRYIRENPREEKI